MDAERQCSASDFLPALDDEVEGDEEESGGGGGEGGGRGRGRGGGERRGKSMRADDATHRSLFDLLFDDADDVRS